MKEIIIKIQDDYFGAFLQQLSQLPKDKVSYKSPKDEILEIMENIDNGKEKLTPLEWEEFNEAINASHQNRKI
ncbi:hypothetical protein BKH46_08830 [Helicobacter sp. 12S02634-8]|uniref:hypothetical protein n=1 Tax=Helicobacter sp. 12S02634-8 TaxID=1476199 RepID=UPI000BA4F277|nr:hypothetical protein [Helicobacter sp. 12S02634-8]PAF46141.1 hypothetical protein BKH46_08830 [Helicobacter sp. 12S02634-8]